jgi:hypothetical protein
VRYEKALTWYLTHCHPGLCAGCAKQRIQHQVVD